MPTPLHSIALVATALALACVAPTAWAGGTIGVHLGSHHFPSKHYNNVNPGLYYRTDDGWTVGGYRNSLSKGSVYAGYTFSYKILMVTAGGVTGYGKTLTPLLVPSISLFTYQGITPRLAYVPKVEKKIGSHVLHLMVEF